MPIKTEKGGHEPDVKSVNADKGSVDVYQWDEWSVDSFDNFGYIVYCQE